MVRPYLRGRRRYILVQWDPSCQLSKGSLIALVKQRLKPLTRGLEAELDQARVDPDRNPEAHAGKGSGDGSERRTGSGRRKDVRGGGNGPSGNPVVRAGLVRFDPPWAVAVVDHRLQGLAIGELNTTWQETELETVAASGTLEALWRRTGRPAPPRD